MRSASTIAPVVVSWAPASDSAAVCSKGHPGLLRRAEQLGKGESVAFLRGDANNLSRRDRAVQLTVDALDGTAFGKRITALGTASKPPQ